MAPNFTITDKGEAVIVEFTIPGETTPAECAEALKFLPDLSGPHILLLSGRGPVWLFAMLLHAGHATRAIATFDPRLGYVVVQSHHADYRVGEIFPA
jgi:CRISPR-associated protein Csx3